MCFVVWRDTTAIESDHINNPGIITQFFQVPDRPFFDLHDSGLPIHVHRGGQGGEDDAGCEKAAPSCVDSARKASTGSVP